jgi:hypothetical protein
MTNEPEDFEAGEDVTDDFDAPQRPAGMVVSVRIAPQDAERLVDLAETSGHTVSQIARQAIRSFLSSSGRPRREATVSSAPDVSLFVRTSEDTAPTEGARAIVTELVST